MIRRVLTIGLCLLCACRSEPSEPAAAAAAPDAAFVLPGQFSERTTADDLRSRFGAANVAVAEVPDGSGAAPRGVVLFPSDPTRRAYVRFRDGDALAGLASISVRDAGSRWRGKHGVHIGMAFAELRRINGKPFGFSGFDQERRGWANDQWSLSVDGEDDRLGALDVGAGEHMAFGVDLALRAALDDVPSDAYPHDDVSLSSDDPRYPRLGELVEVVGLTATISLDDEGQ